MMNIPNILTSARIALIPFFIFFLVEERFMAALIIFAIGSITDALDGFIARRFHQVTRLGQILDPAADKFFLLSSYIAAFLSGLMPFWLTFIAVMKDLITVSGYSFITLKGIKIDIEPIAAGKISTAFQMITILIILLHGLGLVDFTLLLFIMVITSILLFYSTISYVIIGIKKYRTGIE